LQQFDGWLMPTTATIAPLSAPLAADDSRFFTANGYALRNTTVINFLDGCALSIPCQRADELPVGLALCGLAGDDARILGIGRAVEAALRRPGH
jgi:aspartyl-tRNA(Asn)/glutamyl-tRNA(Gln) amidotransferase subunit A